MVKRKAASGVSSTKGKRIKPTVSESLQIDKYEQTPIKTVTCKETANKASINCSFNDESLIALCQEEDKIEWNETIATESAADDAVNVENVEEGAVDTFDPSAGEAVEYEVDPQMLYEQVRQVLVYGIQNTFQIFPDIKTVLRLEKVNDDIAVEFPADNFTMALSIKVVKLYSTGEHDQPQEQYEELQNTDRGANNRGRGGRGRGRGCGRGRIDCKG